MRLGIFLVRFIGAAVIAVVANVAIEHLASIRLGAIPTIALFVAACLLTGAIPLPGVRAIKHALGIGPPEK